jgi:NAD(P)H-hydrate epimerase
VASEPELVEEVELPRLPPRQAESNKGNFGKVLVIAGSRDMAGAAVLAALAALRGGAGLVRLAVPRGIQPIVAASNPCYTTAGLPEDADGRFASSAAESLVELAASQDVIALGPGLGQGAGPRAVVEKLLACLTKPLVLDADGLNAVVGRSRELLATGLPRILTPHPGEFARLLGVDVLTVQANRRTLAVDFARTHGVVLVLKGHKTIVTDGRRFAVNRTGNPGMATGGTGDVLTGLTAALVGQGLGLFEAARLATHVHGLAGDLARDDLGEFSLIAADLPTYLPQAFRKL